MTLKDNRYTYRVTWSDDDNEYVGLCTEFPSLSLLAKDPQAANRGTPWGRRSTSFRLPEF
jgi:hypothetical protein